MNHSILIDTRNFDHKPTYEEICKMHKRLILKDMAIEELIRSVTNGYTFKTCHLSGTQKDSFVSTSLIALDFDNGHSKNGVKIQTSALKPEEVLICCDLLQLPVAAIYTTYSHTSEWPRFRVIFQLDKVITNFKEIQFIYDMLFYLLPIADKKVKATSLIFGGNECLYLNKDAFVTTKSINFLTKIYSLATNEDLDTQRVDNVYLPYFEMASKLSFSFKEVKLGRLFKTPFKSEENSILSTLKETLEEKLFVINHTFNSYAEARNCLLQLPLDKLLGISNNIACLFHEDTHPSASIYQNPETGYYYYKCFACGKHMDLFDFVIYLNNYTTNAFWKAQQYLFSCFGISIRHDEWKMVEYEKLRFNRKILNHIESYQEDFPRVTKTLLKSNTVFRMLMDVCEESLEHVSIKTQYGDALFQVSRSFLEKMCDMSTSKVRNRLDSLLRANLLVVLSDDEVAATSKYYANSSSLKKEYYTISTYYIKLLTYETLSEAEGYLQDFYTQGATIKGDGARQGIALSHNIKKKNITIDYDFIEPQLLSWVKRTLKRKQCFLKKDYLFYAKKQGFSEQYAMSFIVSIVTRFSLKKRILTKEMVASYHLSNQDVRCIAFIGQMEVT